MYIYIYRREYGHGIIEQLITKHHSKFSSSHTGGGYKKRSYNKTDNSRGKLSYIQNFR